MARTAQISKEKRQSIITLRHEGQSIRKKVYSSAVAKPIKRYDETGSHEDRHRKGRPSVTSAAEDKFTRVTSLRNCSPNKCFTVQVTDTSQHQLSTSTSSQHMWELLQDCWKSIPGEAGRENAKSLQSCHQGKGWLL